MYSAQNLKSIIQLLKSKLEADPFIGMWLITILGGVLRLYKLDYQSFWHDEILSMIGADPNKTISEVIEYCRTDQPPAFFLLLHFWLKVFPPIELYSRLLCALIGIMGIPAIFFLGREIKDNSTGLLAALLTSVNYFQLSYSQDLRFYPLLFLGSTLSFLFYLRCIKYCRWQDFLWYTAFTTLVLYTHYYGLVLLASQGITYVFVIFAYNRKIKFIAYSLSSCLLILVLISPWVPQFLSDSATSEFWIQAERFPRFLVAYFYNYLRNTLVFYIGGVAILFFITRLFIVAWKTRKIVRAEFFVLLLWTVLGYVIPYLYSILKMPLLISRYTMIVLPAVLILIALGIESLNRKPLVILVAAVVTISSLFTLFFSHNFYNTIRNEQFREITRRMIQENTDNCYIFGYHSQLFNYYFKTYKYTNYSHVPWEVDYISELNRRDSVWVLSAGGTLWPDLTKALSAKHFHVRNAFSYERTKAELYVKETEATLP